MSLMRKRILGCKTNLLESCFGAGSFMFWTIYGICGRGGGLADKPQLYSPLLLSQCLILTV